MNRSLFYDVALHFVQGEFGPFNPSMPTSVPTLAGSEPQEAAPMSYTTSGGPSGQKFSIRDTLPKSPTTTEKLNQLIPVQRTWMSCRLIYVISLWRLEKKMGSNIHHLPCMT